MADGAEADSQAQWEQQKKARDALDKRKKMNQTILYQFDDDFEKRTTRGGGGRSSIGSPTMESPGLGSPTLEESVASPDASQAESPRRAAGGGGGLMAYQMKMKGLVASGSWNVEVAEGRCDDLPGQIGIIASVYGDWDHRRRLCPVVASRQILKSGKHLFRVQIIPIHRDRALATHGQIKIGFFDSNVDPRESWDTSAKTGRAWYYRSIGNVYDGSQVAPNLVAPGFEPGDLITATLNMVDKKVTFRKARTLVTSEKTSEVLSDEFTIHGVDLAALRFGVQFEKRCPGVLLRDYEEESAEDALYRGKGFKGYGLMHIQRREWNEAAEAFTKAGTYFHIAGDRGQRKLAAEMLKESKVYRDNNGIGTPGSQVFDMIGRNPIVPMVAGFAEKDEDIFEGEGDEDDTQ